MKQKIGVAALVLTVLALIVFETTIDEILMSLTANPFETGKIIRWIIMMAATVLVVALFGYAIRAIWSFDDKSNTITIAPFTVIDPAGKIANAETGLSAMFQSHFYALEEKVKGLREQIEQGQSFAHPEIHAALLGILDKATYVFNETDRRDPFPDLKLQGVDLTGLFAWIGRSLRDPPRSVAFTANLDDNEGVSIAGNIEDLGLKPPHSVWVPPKQDQTLSRAIEALIYVIYQRRLAKNEDRFQRLDQHTFGDMIRRIIALESTPVPTTPNADYIEKAETLLSAVNKAQRQAPDWTMLSMIEARAARLAGKTDVQLAALERAKITADAELAAVTEAGDPPPVKQAALKEKVDTLIGATTLGIELSSIDELPDEWWNLPELSQPYAAPPSTPDSPTTPTPTQEPGPVTRPSAETLEPTGSNVTALRKGFADLAALPDDNKDSLAALAAFYAQYGRHGDEMFLPWNRAFLWHVERRLRALDPTIALPCWGFSSSVPKIYLSPKDASNSLYREKRSTAAKAGVPAPSVMTATQPTLSSTNFQDFSIRAEQLSNQRHVWVGGPDGLMSRVDKAASDPLFYAHRCAIDRLWNTWARMQGNTPRFSPEFLGRRLDPFPLTVGDVLDLDKLGYSYDSP